MNDDASLKGLSESLRSLSLARRVLFMMLAGFVQALCYPPFGVALLLPLTVASFFLLLTGLNVKLAFRVGFAYGFVWFMTDLFWFTRIFSTAAISLWAIMAFFCGVTAGLLVWLPQRLPAIPAWLLIALTWTGIEYYRSELFPLSFGWLGLGYGVLNDHLLARIATCLGCYGVTFVVATVAALIAIAAVKRGSREQVKVAAIAYALFLVLYITPGPAPEKVRPLNLRLVQAPSEDDADQNRLSMAIPGRLVDFIVWPEYSFLSNPLRQRILRAGLEKIAQSNNAYLLFGGEDVFNNMDPAGFRNTAFLLDRTGHLVGTHVKNHTVHLFRDGQKGKEAKAIQTDMGRIGVGICFDMDYPDIARRLTQDGAELLLVPNNDPPNWGPIQRIQHRMMFQMRALECGRWLARADVAGGTSVATPTGVEFARVTTTGAAKLEATVYRSTYKNLFVRGGWRFGSTCFYATVVLWIVALLRRSRHEEQLIRV